MFARSPLHKADQGVDLGSFHREQGGADDLPSGPSTARNPAGTAWERSVA